MVPSRSLNTFHEGVESLAVYRSMNRCGHEAPSKPSEKFIAFKLNTHFFESCSYNFFQGEIGMPQLLYEFFFEIADLTGIEILQYCQITPISAFF